MKKGAIIFIGIIAFCVLIISLLFFNKGRIIYSNTFYYPMGSERVRIYENGGVEIDLEIEEPNHKPNFKKIKTLTDDEIKQLTDVVARNIQEEEIKKYINLLIHDNANYNLGLPNMF